jgi:hypothetical protein
MSKNGHNDHDSGIDKQEIADLWQKSLTQGLSEARHNDNDDGPDTIKLFGVLEVDSGVAKAASSVITALGGEITHALSPKTYGFVLGLGKKNITGHTLQGKTLYRTAAGVTLGVNLGVLLFEPISQFTQAIKDQHQERVDITKKVAPILDDLKGNHRVASFMGMSEATNSVIYAHRRRMHKFHTVKTHNIVLAGLGKNAINIAREAVNVQGFAKGIDRDLIIKENNHERSEEIRRELKATYKKDDKLSDYEMERRVSQRLQKEAGDGGAKLALFGGTAGLSAIVDTMVQSSEKRLKKNRQPYSALEMILALEEQMQNNPGHSDHFQLPGRQGGELPLDKYVSEIFKLHQREMADIDPKHSEIRKALAQDLDHVGQAIAEKLKAGDLSPLLLIHLVGEGKIVKKKGRGIASADEVKEQVERFANKSRSYDVADPKEFLAERNFDLAKVKQGLEHLHGEEKLDFASTLPDGLLKDAGMGEKEIKQVQAHRVQPLYDEYLTNTISGIAAHSDEELQKGGLGKTQITKLREAAESIAQGGEEALHALKNGPTNGEGIEHLINDYAVPKIAGDKDYLGKLISDGKSKAAEMAQEVPPMAANDEDGMAPGKHSSRFTNKSRAAMEDRHDLGAANDDEPMGFADRENGRDEAQHGRF